MHVYLRTYLPTYLPYTSPSYEYVTTCKAISYLLKCLLQPHIKCLHTAAVVAEATIPTNLNPPGTDGKLTDSTDVPTGFR